MRNIETQLKASIYTMDSVDALLERKSIFILHSVKYYTEKYSTIV